MKIYNKLVRDKIPQIITEHGKQCEVKILPEEEYEQMLIAKLLEEAKESTDADPSQIVEELADLVEVVYALLQLKGVSREEFDRIRLQKREERGGFDDRVFLIKVWDHIT